MIWGLGLGISRAAEARGRWHKLPLPAITYRGFSDMGIEPGGTLWVVANNAVYRWDGERFSLPRSAKLTASSYYLCRLYGGGDRPLYLTQSGDKEHQGKLYSLADGDARYVTDFEYEVTNGYPGLHVSRSGAVLNWGKGFLAAWSGGKWQRIEAGLSRRGTVVLDAGKAVHFYYQGSLCTFDGRLTERSLATAVLAEQGSVVGALWGSDRMLALTSGGKGVRVYDLTALTPVFPPAVLAAFDERETHDLFRVRDGSLFVYTDDPETEGRVFRRISPEGRVERLGATAGLEWDAGRAARYPGSVLGASDGSLWLGLPYSGVVRYKDGKLHRFGWKEGLGCGGTRHLLEDGQGRVYAAGRRAIYLFRPGEPPGPPPPDVGLWQELELASYRPTRDSDGNVWMFLKDRPGAISRWDGRAWRHVTVPFDTTKVSHGMADDRGRLLLLTEEGCFIIGPAGVERHEDVKTMLEWAIVDGATRFDAGLGLQGCIVLDGGRIWFGLYNRRTASYFDGALWHTVRFQDTVNHLNESAQYGVLLRTQGGRYYTHDGGGWPWPVSVSRRRQSRWLLGPKGYQPFEGELLARHPGRYVPVEVGSGGTYRLLAAPEGGEPGRYVAGSQLSSSIRAVTPGFHGGHWSEQLGSGSVARRIFGGRVITCQCSDSPLAGWYYSVRQILDDRGHNLWFYLGSYGGSRRVVLKRLSGFRLKLGAVPAEAVRSVSLTAEPVLPGLDAGDLRLFWRFEGGAWQGGLPGGQAAIRFPADGDYTIELLGMDRQGGTTPETERLVIRARVPLPETELTAKGPYRITDVIWRAPIKLVPSERGADTYLLYRIDGGTWRLASSRRYVTLGRVSPGSHAIEFAAREQRYFRDPTPVRIAVVYAPDPEYIVSSRLKLLASSKARTASWARSSIMMAGPIVIPVLEKKLAEAKDQPTLAAQLRALLAELRPKPRR